MKPIHNAHENIRSSHASRTVVGPSDRVSRAAWLAQHDDRLPSVHTVAVLLDGTTAAKQALPYALSIARRSGATIRLVRSCVSQSSVWQRMYRRKLSTQSRQQVRSYLQSVAQQIRANSDLRVTQYAVESDKQLLMATTGVDLVVLAAPRAGFAQRLSSGTLASILLRRVPGPLLLVPSQIEAVGLWDAPVPGQVLLSLDGTRVASKVLESEVIGKWLQDSRFTLAHFQKAAAIVDYAKLGEVQDSLRAASAHFQDRVRDVDTEIIISDEPASTAILSIAEERKIDLVALSTRSRGWMARLVTPSIVTAVVRGATKVPVLLFGASAESTFRGARRAQEVS